MIGCQKPYSSMHGPCFALSSGKQGTTCSQLAPAPPVLATPVLHLTALHIQHCPSPPTHPRPALPTGPPPPCPLAAVDMDAFYASVEQLDAPALADVPMAVGGIGMICTANYHARKFGVRSAMPGFIARRLCPQLVFVKPDFTKYTAASELTRAIFRDYDPEFEAGEGAASSLVQYLQPMVAAGCSTAA